MAPFLAVGDSCAKPFRYTQRDVEQFAAISGDTNPIHLDSGYAANTVFKKPIIHGMLTASMFSQILGCEMPGEGTIYLKQSLQFLQPMFVEVDYRGAPAGARDRS